MKHIFLLFILIIPFSNCQNELTEIQFDGDSLEEIYPSQNDYAHFYMKLNNIESTRKINFYFNDQNYNILDQYMRACLTSESTIEADSPFSHCIGNGAVIKYLEISNKDEKHLFYNFWLSEYSRPLFPLEEKGFTGYLVVRYVGVNSEGKIKVRVASTNLYSKVKDSISSPLSVDTIIVIVIGSINILFFIILTAAIIYIYCKRKSSYNIIESPKAQQPLIVNNNSSNKQDLKELSSI